MSYQTALPIIEVMEQIHRKKYLLPAIQREFVWDTEQIERLFDSLLRSYPISSFLFWKVNKDKVHDFEFYEFIKNYHEKNNRHNPKATMMGEEEVIAILDGQQRLTSLYIGLMGSYAYKLPRKKWDNDLAYPKRRLYLNLLHPSKDPDLFYEFSFLTETESQVKNEKTFWFPVYQITNFRELGHVLDFLMENDLTNTSIYPKETAKFAKDCLSKLYEIIHVSKTISYYLEQSNELDKVLNIFIRINSGGTILSYSDLLLSIATAQWENKDARKEINEFVNEINRIGDGFNFNKDFVLKSCLVLSSFNDIAFKVDNFNKSNMLKIEESWNSITRAIRLAVNLVASFGFNRETLTSTNAIIPIALYLKRINASDSFDTSTKNIEDRAKIKKWLILSLLKRVFSGQPDNVLRQIRKAIIDNDNSFPLKEIISSFTGTNKTLVFSHDDIENLIHFQYGQNFTFQVLSILYPTLDFRNLFHVDHIFPKSLFTPTRLRNKDIEESEIEFYIDNFNHLPNLQLMEPISNMEKSGKDFKTWLNELHPDEQEQKDYKRKNLIPDIDLSLNNFKEFFNRRQEIIINKLEEVLKVEI